MCSICSELLKKLLKALTNDVLAKHENQNHSRTHDYRADRVRNLDHRKVQPGDNYCLIANTYPTKENLLK